MKRFAITFIGVNLIALGLAASAPAATIIVDSTADSTADDGVCTLREAITAANANAPSADTTGACAAGDSGLDTIDFAGFFDGGGEDAISLGSALPTASEDLAIDAGDCGTGGEPSPCVGLDGIDAGFTGLGADAGVNLSVRGLAITDMSVGVTDAGDDSGTLTVEGNWFGLMLDGTVAPNEIGAWPDSGAVIGGTDAADRNVFAADTTHDAGERGAGVLIVGGESNTITGNYFSTLADGSKADGAQNDDDVRISADYSGYPTIVPATNNTVGGADAGTPSVCDGACNLLGNAVHDGVNLVGITPAEGPATGTNAVRGNFIGLGLDGGSDLGNGEVGVAAGVGTLLLGGAAPGEGNRIAHNPIGATDADGTGVEIRGNYFGLSADGSALAPAAPASTWQAIQSESDGAQITGNRIGGSRLVAGGDDDGVYGNVIGVGTGGEDAGVDGFALLVSGDHSTIGAAGNGNTIGNQTGAAGAAIGVLGNHNIVQSNLIGHDGGGDPQPNEGDGIALAPTAGQTAVDNLIGGLTDTADANQIYQTGGDAIQLNNDGSDENTIVINLGRDNGADNRDIFIDLNDDSNAADGEGNTPAGPDGGIAAPTISSAGTTEITGTSTEEAGTEIRVYTTFTHRDDVDEYLGMTTVGPTGDWSLTYPSTLAAGWCITANQTTSGLGSSEMAPPVSVGDDGGPCDRHPPVTTITGPSTSGPHASFKFVSSKPGPTEFECSFDHAAFIACLSPAEGTFGDGPHQLQVRATDQIGILGPTATKSFSVDATLPTVRLKRVRLRRRRQSAVLIFGASEFATFFCRLDRNARFPCRSPIALRHLRRGRHIVRLTARDAVGNYGPTRVIRFKLEPPGKPKRKRHRR